jgi:hypothetical protein
VGCDCADWQLVYQHINAANAILRRLSRCDDSAIDRREVAGKSLRERFGVRGGTVQGEKP